MNKKENLYTPNSIRTFSGHYFDLMIMDPDTICIEDIAHGLSHMPRFAGQLEQFLTVAQHSVMAYMNASPENRLAALMHDASEAYLCDMPSPFKKLLPDYQAIEKRLSAVIAEKYDFRFPYVEQIKSIDRFMLNLEWKGLVEKSEVFEVWSPEVAKKKFLCAFEDCKLKEKIKL